MIPDDLVNAFYERRGVFFVSAGCSIPSGLPPAAALAHDVTLAAHAGNQQPIDEYCQTTFGSTAPTLDEVAEFFYQRDGNVEAFAALIPFQNWSQPPNAAHVGIVRLAVEGFFDKVLTTNWDLLLETACHNMACSHISLRSADDLSLRRDVQLSIFKIHGCKTDTSSLIAATTQLESDEATYLWAEPQVVAAFQGSCVTFLGYSGAVPKISRSMAHVARWSQQAGVQHFAVDIAAWADFQIAAPDFVTAASLDEARYSSSGAADFVSELVHRLIRRLVLEIGATETPEQFQQIRALASGPLQDFASPTNFIDQVAGGEAADELLRITTRQFDRYPSIAVHRSMLGKLFAWVAVLQNFGWQPIDGTPVLRRDDELIYLAASDPGGAATRAMFHVNQTLKQRREFSRTILGMNRPTRCILMGAQGDLTVASTSLAVNAPASDLTYGQQPTVIFYTETQFISEIEAA